MEKIIKFKQRLFKQIDIVSQLNWTWDRGSSMCTLGTSGVKVIEYKQKIGDSKEAIAYLNEIVQGYGNFVQMCAETSAGKSWIMSHIFKENKEEKAPEGFIGKKYINCLVVPNHDQAIQIANDYGLKVIVAGHEIYRVDLEDNFGFVIVYDKIKEIDDLVKQIPNFQDNYKINLVIDEAHNIIQSLDFREDCIKDILNTTNIVRELNGNVIYMTASFEALAAFDFTKTICFFSKIKKENINDNKIQIVVKNEGVEDYDFYARELAYEIKNGNIPFVRLQKKELPENFIGSIEKVLNRSLSWTQINSDERDSEVVKNIIETSTLPEVDIIFSTSMLDAGTNITSVGGKQSTNIIPIFVMDGNNYNVDNIEQFFNRIRWCLPKKKILISKNYDCEQQSFVDIFKEEYKELNEEQNMLNSMYIFYKNKFKDVNKSKKFMKDIFNRIMEEGGYSSNPYLFINEEEQKVDCDYLKFFKFVREELYMKQFLNPQLLKQKLETIFESLIEFSTPSGEFNDIEIIKETEETRMILFSEMLKDIKRMKEFDEKKGEDYEKYKNSEVMKDYTIMRRKMELQEVITNLSSKNSKQLKVVTREICKQELLELKQNDKKALVEKLNNENPRYSYDIGKVKNVLDGEFEKELKSLIGLVTIDKAISIIQKFDKPVDLRNEILYLQAKVVNREYMQQFPPCGKFEREQYTFIRSIEELREGTTLLLTKDNFTMERLIEKMNNSIRNGKYSPNKLLKIASRVYKYREMEKGFLLYELRQ